MIGFVDLSGTVYTHFSLQLVSNSILPFLYVILQDQNNKKQSHTFGGPLAGAFGRSELRQRSEPSLLTGKIEVNSSLHTL